jgi:hypothetical protein
MQMDFNCEPYFRAVDITETIDHTTTPTVITVKTHGIKTDVNENPSFPGKNSFISGYQRKDCRFVLKKQKQLIS